jgi:hypothetical protein
MTMVPRRSLSTFRSGAAAVECAITLPVVMFVLFAMLDLGLATIRYNALAAAARCIAREAILHGSLAPAATGSWGVNEFSGTAADGAPMTISLSGILPTMEADEVGVRVAWPDGDNSPRSRVKVDLTYQHHSVAPGLALWGPIDLRAETTMHIVN